MASVYKDFTTTGQSDWVTVRKGTAIMVVDSTGTVGLQIKDQSGNAVALKDGSGNATYTASEAIAFDLGAPFDVRFNCTAVSGGSVECTLRGTL